MKIIVLDGYTLAADGNTWASLERLGDVEIYDRSNLDEMGQRAHSATILVTNKAPIPSEVIERSPSLRFIAVSATGHDCVDVMAAKRRGIPVSNVPEYGTHSVAQFTFALLLELCHHVGLHADLVRSGEWSNSPNFCFWRAPQVELAGKTMGISFGEGGLRPGDLMHANVPGHMAGARQEASVVLAGWLEARGDIGRVAEHPNLVARANGQLLSIHGHAHGTLETSHQG